MKRRRSIRQESTLEMSAATLLSSSRSATQSIRHRPDGTFSSKRACLSAMTRSASGTSPSSMFCQNTPRTVRAPSQRFITRYLVVATGQGLGEKDQALLRTTHGVVARRVAVKGKGIVEEEDLHRPPGKNGSDIEPPSTGSGNPRASTLGPWRTCRKSASLPFLSRFRMRRMRG